MSEQTQQTNSAPWYGEIPADQGEIKTWVEAKGFKDPLAALTSYHNAEKLLGAPADQIIRLPKADDAEGWGKTFDRLGRPGKPEEYEIPLPEGDDGALAKAMAPLFHKAGLSKAQAKAIAEGWNAHIGQLQGAEKQEQEAREQKATAELNALKQEWGADFEKRAQFAKRGAAAYGKQAGLDDADIGKLETALGTTKLLKLFHALGETMKEDGFTGGEGGTTFGLTQSQASVKLGELQQKRVEGKISEQDYWSQREELDKVLSRAA